MARTFDVIVVGAGPSGLQAARRLAQGGLSVCVLERKSKVGDSVICAGIIGREVFADHYLPLTSVLREVRDVRLVSPSGSALQYSHPSGFAFVVDRERFDADLGAEARRAGAEIRTGTHVEDIRQADEGLRVFTKTGRGVISSVSGRMAVIATGVHGELTKKLRLGVPGKHLFGAQVEVESDDDILTIYTGTEVSRGGFAWAVPSKPGMVRYGLITEGDPRAGFRSFVERHLNGRAARLGSSPVQYKAIAQGLTSRTFGPRMLVLGEAAGQVKTTTGGGVAFGMKCAEIASRVIAQGLKESRLSARALSEYEKLWKAELRSEIVIGLMARRIWAMTNDAAIERIFEFVRTDGVIPLIRDKGRFDRHGELILALLRRMDLFGVLPNFVKRLPRLN